MPHSSVSVDALGSGLVHLRGAHVVAGVQLYLEDAGPVLPGDIDAVVDAVIRDACKSTHTTTTCHVPSETRRTDH